MSTIRVGILTRKEIKVVFHGKYSSKGTVLEGEHTLTQAGFYAPTTADCSFDLCDVTIGIDFHWERNETQTFKGSLEIARQADGPLTAINVLDIEDYLQSVISSEMSATSHIELLKAHAVISRSWALCKIQRSQQASAFALEETADKRICWYGSEPHDGFDVCADDHCQRYQGLRAKDHKNAIKAVTETQGQVLAYPVEASQQRSNESTNQQFEICDARFYKCCGGVTEEFESCWEDTHHPYLVRVVDNSINRLVDLSISQSEASKTIDLTKEENAREWIIGSPDAFCNTTDKHILSQVLNDYDQETIDFYRWEVNYSVQELSALIRKKSGIDFGEIVDLIPLKRGVSGRIYELKIVGTKKTLTIGKELEIRKWLSESHLYSSAFVVEKSEGKFTLYGAGWGHGVGLCQIGAAVMAEKGYTYQEILAHYYPNTEIKLGIFVQGECRDKFTWLCRTAARNHERSE
ncbi:MAG: SpoIID/LytB domain-containing protein [Paludibacteraceae bacterium]|nr:SpoIID/LytB domain-containing protein [Paludibacteraceae bacterium]